MLGPSGSRSLVPPELICRTFSLFVRECVPRSDEYRFKRNPPSRGFKSLGFSALGLKDSPVDRFGFLMLGV